MTLQFLEDDIWELIIQGSIVVILLLEEPRLLPPLPSVTSWSHRMMFTCRRAPIIRIIEYSLWRGTKTHSEGDPSWDSTETSVFIDDNLANRPTDQFFEYVALGSVHFPAIFYVDGSPSKGQHKTAHHEMITLRSVWWTGQLVSWRQWLRTVNLAEETIIIFTIDYGGMGMEIRSISGLLRASWYLSSSGTVGMRRN